MTSPIDIEYMRHALSLARRGLGRVSPNPAVGCVLVKNGAVIGRGWTGDGGRPHAEARALEIAGAAAKGATAYVTLEPCAHHGQTPPCAKALIDAGILRVVVACGDPDPRVDGGGLQMLRDAGVFVEMGACEDEALAINAGFFLRVKEQRPFVTLKLAVSCDGKIAAGAGQRTQISGEIASRYMHLLRSQHDAIMVGAETARVDAPQLTTRIDGYEHHSQRFILGTAEMDGFHTVSGEIKDVLADMAGRGITRLLVEGGAKVHAAFLEAGLFDDFHLIRAPDNIGAGGVEALAGHDIFALQDEFGLKCQKTRALGKDLLEIYRPNA